MVKNLVLHFNLINKHRWKVFLLCIKAGIPFRGLVHDLSKYSPVEFFEGVKYFSGDKSPISHCKKDIGYSNAWLHHKGRNKHHHEYWYDYNAADITPIIPYKYVVEMICDNLAAGITYQGKNWTKEYQLSYWNKAASKDKIHPKLVELLDRVYTDVSIKGLDEVIKGKNLDRLYYEYIEK